MLSTACICREGVKEICNERHLVRLYLVSCCALRVRNSRESPSIIIRLWKNAHVRKYLIVVQLIFA